MLSSHLGNLKTSLIINLSEVHNTVLKHFVFPKTTNSTETRSTNSQIPRISQYASWPAGKLQSLLQRKTDSSIENHEIYSHRMSRLASLVSRTLSECVGFKNRSKDQYIRSGWDLKSDKMRKLESCDSYHPCLANDCRCYCLMTLREKWD